MGKSDNSDANDERRTREEEKLCKLIIKGFAEHHRERRALLATAEEKINVPSVVMTSQAKNSCGLKFAKLGVILECPRKLTNVQQSQSNRSLQ